jgi:hypothetical protein
MATLEFSDSELKAAATGARTAAHRVMHDAAAPATSREDYGFRDTATRYAALAVRFEQARSAPAR